MKIMILCGVFADENVNEVVDNAVLPVEISANVMQQKIINGFSELNEDISVLSAPLIGSWPNASRIVQFRGFKNEQSYCTYVKFNNIWGLRNFSRARSLKKALKNFIDCESNEKLILVYCPHTPFLEAAVYAKKKDPRIKLCLYVPDLPQYMNLSASRTFIYDIAKKYDIFIMEKLMKDIDAFVLLTEPMKGALRIGNRPYIVVEGIVDSIFTSDKETKNTDERYIVYTGKLYESFGVKNLIDSFKYIDNSECRLILCGCGDCDDYANKAAETDPRIRPLGQILPDEAVMWQKRADVLVNPRSNDDEYTKYSFPSKNIEYLLTGNPVVAYMLDGMPSVYRDFLFPIEGNNPEEIAAVIKAALNIGREELHSKYNRFIDYAQNKLMASRIAKEIINVIK